MTEQHRMHGDPQSIVAMIPALLGFIPETSTVVVGLSDLGRVLVTLRVDLIHDAYSDPFDDVVLPTSANDVDAAVIVTYSDDAATASENRGVLAARLAAEGVRTAITLHVDANAITDARGRQHQLPSEEQYAAARRALGSDAAASREDLIGALEPITTRDVAEHIAQVVATATEPAQVVADPAHALAAFEALCTEHITTGQITPEAIGRYALDVAQTHYRDAVCAVLAADDTMPNAHEVTVYLARRVPREYHAPAYTIAGLALYLKGRGLEAMSAFTHALAATANYNLARLLQTSLRAGIPPHALREMMQRAAE